MKARTFGGSQFQDMQNFQSEGLPSQGQQYRTSSHLSYDNSKTVGSRGTKGTKNLQHYTFGGMTNIRKTALYNQLAHNGSKQNSAYNPSSEPGFESGRENLTGFGEVRNPTDSDFYNLQKPKKAKVPNFFDQAYGTNIRKKARERPMS